MAAAITPLAEERERLDIHRSTIARDLKADYSHLYRIERGEVQASPDLANRLAKYLQPLGSTITRDQILFPEDYRPRKKPSRKSQEGH